MASFEQQEIEYIKELVTVHNRTQEQVAQVMNVSEKSIRRVCKEHGWQRATRVSEETLKLAVSDAVEEVRGL